MGVSAPCQCRSFNKESLLDIFPDEESWVENQGQWKHKREIVSERRWESQDIKLRRDAIRCGLLDD
jgi:hypothetical protein